MRGRLIAFVIALAVLAFAEIRGDDHASTAQWLSGGASSQLAEPPAPEPGLPGIIAEVVGTSATVRTAFVVQARHPLSSAVGAPAVSRPLPVVAQSTGKPRSFPLLI